MPTNAAWGRAWHTPTNPPLSQRQVIDALSRTANGELVQVHTVSPLAVKALGIFVPDLRELSEIRYQLDASFVVDSTAAQAIFGLEPTPLFEAFDETISWYRHRSTSKDHTDAREHHHSS